MHVFVGVLILHALKTVQLCTTGIPHVLFSFSFKVESDEVVNMSSTVFRLANKTLRLDKAKG